MNNGGPVNVRRFTLYAIIPGLDYYATTKLNKKKPTAVIFVIFVSGLMISNGIIMYSEKHMFMNYFQGVSDCLFVFTLGKII